jgi:hypothetical protein
MKKWIIFTIIYILITVWLASMANENIFGPDKESTISIAVIVYVIVIILFFAFKGIKKLFKH